jgi:hypothetical protein
MLACLRPHDADAEFKSGETMVSPDFSIRKYRVSCNFLNVATLPCPFRLPTLFGVLSRATGLDKRINPLPIRAAGNQTVYRRDA